MSLLFFEEGEGMIAPAMEGSGSGSGNVKGPRELVVRTPTKSGGGKKRESVAGMGKGTPGSLYDGDGFLREGGKAI